MFTHQARYRLVRRTLQLTAYCVPGDNDYSVHGLESAGSLIRGVRLQRQGLFGAGTVMSSRDESAFGHAPNALVDRKCELPCVSLAVDYVLTVVPSAEGEMQPVKGSTTFWKPSRR